MASVGESDVGAVGGTSLDAAHQGGRPTAIEPAACDVVGVRVFHSGSPASRGKVVLCKSDGDSVMTGHALRAVVAELADLDHFDAFWYSAAWDGWVRLETGQSVPVTHHGERRIDVRVEPRQHKLAATHEGHFFGIGIVRGKTESNHGLLWRTAYQMGASFVFTVGARFESRVDGMTDTYACSRTVRSALETCIPRIGRERQSAGRRYLACISTPGTTS